MNKPRRQCIFCDNPANSREHIWSEWMHPLLADSPDAKHDRQTISKWPDGREQISGPSSRSGGIITVKVRAVCERCNSGWMNIKERDVRPFLDAMIAGEPVTLDGSQIEALAQWCALKFIVMEHASTDTALTPGADRVALRERGVIPPYFRIYVGNHASGRRSGLYRSSRCMALSTEGPKPPLGGMSKNIQTTTIVLGRLFIHLNAARVDGFEIESRYKIFRVWNECRIWPDGPDSRRWPHRPLIDDDGLSMVANTLGTLFSGPNTTWFETLPDS